VAQVDIELACKVSEFELEWLVKLAHIEHDGLADELAQVVLAQLAWLNYIVAQEAGLRVWTLQELSCSLQ